MVQDLENTLKCGLLICQWRRKTEKSSYVNTGHAVFHRFGTRPCGGPSVGHVGLLVVGLALLSKMRRAFLLAFLTATGTCVSTAFLTTFSQCPQAEPGQLDPGLPLWPHVILISTN